MEGVRLKRLKIDKYRNVAPGTELVFNDGFNVLLGKNGTGKTTLLRLIAMVVKGTFEHLEDDDLGLEYELVFPGLRIIAAIRNDPRGELATTSSGTDNVLDTSSPQHEPTWSCTFSILLTEERSTKNLCTISTDPQRAILHFDGRDHPIAVQSPFGYNAAHNLLYQALIRLRGIMSNPANTPDETTPRGAWSSVIDRLLSTTRLLDVMIMNGGRFDEALGGLDAITFTGENRDDYAGDLDLAVLWMPESDRRNIRRSRLIPGQLHDAIIRISTSDLAAGNLRFEHGSLRFLQEAAGVLGVNGLTLIVPLDQKTVSEERNVFIYTRFEFLVTIADGTIISHKHLSYGQKRLLSFLYYAACNPDIVIADELVNGLHYEWIGACLEKIQDRQSFLTSQNPVLLDMLPIESADDVRRCFILCSNEVRDGRGQMVWKTMSEQSAGLFYRAYETQALQVSEILRVNDLW